VSFFSLSLLQQEQSQLFASALVSLASALGPLTASAFIFIGQDAPSAIFVPDTVACSDFFIGQESPVQQSQSSQHEAISLLDVSFFFIGHESPLQQQHDTVVADEMVVLVNAKAAIESPKTINAAIASIIFFFMICVPYV
jgi:hypothetical protein